MVDRRSRFAAPVFLVIGWCLMLVYSGLHSRHLGFAATAGHTVDTLHQESMKKVVLECAEKQVAWQQKTFQGAGQTQETSASHPSCLTEALSRIVEMGQC